MGELYIKVIINLAGNISTFYLNVARMNGGEITQILKLNGTSSKNESTSQFLYDMGWGATGAFGNTNYKYKSVISKASDVETDFKMNLSSVPPMSILINTFYKND